MKVKEFMREIIVCGLPSSKASRIPRGLIKPRAAVVGGRRGQSDGNYEARRNSRNGREVILLDLARGGGGRPSIIVAPCLPSLSADRLSRDLHAARTGTPGIEILIRIYPSGRTGGCAFECS